MQSNHKQHRRRTLSYLNVIIFSFISLTTVYIVKAAPIGQSNEQGKAIFEQRCIACHTIGDGPLVGPDLLGVTTRRERDWLVQFIGAPNELIDEGDPIATKLLEEYNNIVMPNLGLTDSEIEAILAYIESQETTPGEKPPTEPLLDGDLERGWNIFTGERRLTNGGVPCMSCHNIGGIGRFGGGTLGPDLTHVHQRYGENGLASALDTITFPTMQGVYAEKPLTNQEQADLRTFLAWADAEGDEKPASQFNSSFWTWGAIGMVALFSIMAVFWPRQRESISTKLRNT
ncbi:MAG: cytochrome c [Anaerolineales bacterium]|jgi:mono/diheme cytochrome c family protein